MRLDWEGFTLKGVVLTWLCVLQPGVDSWSEGLCYLCYLANYLNLLPVSSHGRETYQAGGMGIKWVSLPLARL